MIVAGRHAGRQAPGRLRSRRRTAPAFTVHASCGSTARSTCRSTWCRRLRAARRAAADANGKIDRKHLPKPSQERLDVGDAYVAPRTRDRGAAGGHLAQVIGVSTGRASTTNSSHSAATRLLVTQVVSRVAVRWHVDCRCERCSRSRPSKGWLRGSPHAGAAIAASRRSCRCLHRSAAAVVPAAAPLVRRPARSGQRVLQPPSGFLDPRRARTTRTGSRVQHDRGAPRVAADAVPVGRTGAGPGHRARRRDPPRSHRSECAR